MFRLVLLLIGLMFQANAYAAECWSGYYRANNECLECNPNKELFYCPGDDVRHPCPTGTNTDYVGALGDLGFYQILTEKDAADVTRSPLNAESQYCQSHLDVMDRDGNIFNAHCQYRDEYRGYTNGYYYCGMLRYLTATTGWYLSKETKQYLNQQGDIVHVIYNVPNRCTNAPESHAYYTGAGTLGGNDCPFKCDAGYVHSAFNNICTTLCTAGFTQLKTSSGVTVNVYADKPTTPALNISTSRGTCYVALAPGAQDGAINVQYGGNTYHTVD